MTACPWARGVHRIFASSERKATDAAQVLADGLGLDGYSVIATLGENDRSATGFLAKDEFEATVDAFFAQPLQSIRRWEPAAQMPRHGLSAPSSRPCRKPLSVRTSPLSGMAAREPCSIATSQGCRSIAATTSPRQMAGTGSPSTGRAENFYVTAGSRSTQWPGKPRDQLTWSICRRYWRSPPRLASEGRYASSNSSRPTFATRRNQGRTTVIISAGHQGIVTVTGGVQRGSEVRPRFMRRQPHLATGRLLRL
jgi:hypothetical protein